MTRFLKKYLNVADLQKTGGQYEGIIENVIKTEIRNRYTKQPSQEAVVEFRDGQRMVLNLGMVRECIQLFGADSVTWGGHRVRVYLVGVESVNRTTGEARVAWHRKIACLELEAVLTAEDVFREKQTAEDRRRGEPTWHPVN